MAHIAECIIVFDTCIVRVEIEVGGEPLCYAQVTVFTAPLECVIVLSTGIFGGEFEIQREPLSYSKVSVSTAYTECNIF